MDYEAIEWRNGEYHAIFADGTTMPLSIADSELAGILRSFSGLKQVGDDLRVFDGQQWVSLGEVSQEFGEPEGEGEGGLEYATPEWFEFKRAQLGRAENGSPDAIRLENEIIQAQDWLKAQPSDEEILRQRKATAFNALQQEIFRQGLASPRTQEGLKLAQSLASLLTDEVLAAWDRSNQGFKAQGLKALPFEKQVDALVNLAVLRAPAELIEQAQSGVTPEQQRRLQEQVPNRDVLEALILAHNLFPGESRQVIQEYVDANLPDLEEAYRIETVQAQLQGRLPPTFLDFASGMVAAGLPASIDFARQQNEARVRGLQAEETLRAEANRREAQAQDIAGLKRSDILARELGGDIETADRIFPILDDEFRQAVVDGRFENTSVGFQDFVRERLDVEGVAQEPQKRQASQDVLRQQIQQLEADVLSAPTEEERSRAQQTLGVRKRELAMSQGQPPPSLDVPTEREELAFAQKQGRAGEFLTAKHFGIKESQVPTIGFGTPFEETSQFAAKKASAFRSELFAATPQEEEGFRQFLESPEVRAQLEGEVRTRQEAEREERAKSIFAAAGAEDALAPTRAFGPKDLTFQNGAAVGSLFGPKPTRQTQLQSALASGPPSAFSLASVLPSQIAELRKRFAATPQGAAEEEARKRRSLFRGRSTTSFAI